MGWTTDPIHVLHVDDDPGFVDLTTTCLERADDRLAVRSTTSPDEGLALLDDEPVDCVVSDYEMPGMDGIDFLEAVRADYPDLPFILFTGKGSETVASEAISAGVTDYLQKEGGTDQYTILANRIRNAVSARQSADDAERRRYRLEQILKTVPSCVVQLDREGRFVFANDRAVEVLGLTESALTERRYNDPDWQITDMDGDPIPDDELPFRRVLESGEPLYDFRHTISWPDGTEKVLSVNGAPLFGADGEVETVVFSLTDVTERLAHEDQLRQTTARLEALFENSPDMINVHDDAGTIVDPNAQLCAATGYDESELTGMKVWELDRAIDPESARELWSGMAVGDREELDGEYERQDGSTFPVRVHIRRLDIEGEDRFLAISRDVSERKARERRLEATKRRLDAILANTTMPMFMKDDEGRYLFVNEGYRELFDLHDEEIVGRTDQEIHPPEVAEEVRSNDRAVLERGEALDVNERITADGETRTFLVSKVPIYDTGTRSDPDRPVAVFGVGSDITELSRRERTLRDFQRRTESLVRASTHEEIAAAAVEIARETFDLPLSGIHLVDETGERLVPAAVTREVHEHLDRAPAYDRTDPTRSADSSNWEIFERGETVVIEDTHDHDLIDASDTPSRSGIVHPLGDHGLFITSSPEPHAFDEADVALTEILATIVTASLDRADREAALAERKRQLEAETERLDEFTRVVSHDLRSPLSVAQGHLELAREECDSDHLEEVQRSHDRMATLVEDLLALAREGHPATDVTTVDLATLAEAAWDHVATPEATLVVDTDRTVQADEGRLTQLFENLVRNAVEHAGADVIVTVGDLEDGFFVEDDGPGIDPGERAHVFEAGYSTDEDGNGFGLSIVQQVAAAHGWTVAVTDGSEGGARFEFTDVAFVDA